MEVNKTEDEVSSVEVLEIAVWTKVQMRKQVKAHLNISPTEDLCDRTLHTIPFYSNSQTRKFRSRNFLNSQPLPLYCEFTVWKIWSFFELYFPENILCTSRVVCV